MEPKKQYYKNIGDTIIKNLSKRNMEAFYCETKEQALEKALSLVNKNKVISFGGSKTLEEIGLLDTLEKENYQLINRNKATSSEEKEKMHRDTFFSDVYFMSSNAITFDGQLVNIDGNGNRVAALIFGPKQVIIIAGMNKLAETVEDAVKRVQNFATPANTVRLNKNTPCATTGKCHNCIDPTICCQIVITRKSMHDGRIKIILVGETLGY